MWAEFCAPDYYLWTLKNWLAYIERALAELGVRIEARYWHCEDVYLNLCGRVYRGLPDNEGVLLELILSACLKNENCNRL